MSISLRNPSTVAGGGVSGSGTVDYVVRWTPDGSTLGIGVIRDNGTNVAVGTTVNSVIRLLSYKDGATAGKAISGQNNSTSAGNNVGVDGQAYGTAPSGVNIGGWFLATGGGNNYAVKLQDGTQAAGLFLKSMTSAGEANWAPADNLYLIDGTLDGDRVVTMSGNDLSFEGGKTHLKGAGVTSATTVLLVENAASTNLLTIKDDGSVSGLAVIYESSGTLSTLRNGSGSITGDYNTISGGTNINITAGTRGTISGGQNHAINSGNYNTIGGGLGITMSTGANASTASGGVGHTITNEGCFVGGGTTVTLSGLYAVCCGGSTIVVSGSRGVNVGGQQNIVDGTFSGNLGGQNNDINGQIKAFIVGSDITADRANCTFVEKLTVTTGDVIISGSGSTSATKALTIENSSSTSLLTVEDDGGVFIGVAPASSSTAPILARNSSTGEIETRTLASIKPTLSKTMTLDAPTSSDNVTMFRTDVAITVQEVIAVSKGTTPSTTYKIKHSTDRSAAGNDLTTSAATTSTTTGDVATLDDATIPANSWVWLETSAASGTGVVLSIDLRYTED